MKRSQFVTEDILVNKKRYLLSHYEKCENIKQRSQELDKTLNSMLAKDLKELKGKESQKTI